MNFSKDTGGLNFKIPKGFYFIMNCRGLYSNVCMLGDLEWQTSTCMHQIIAKSIKIYLEKFDQSLIFAGEKLEVHPVLTYGWGLLIWVHSFRWSIWSPSPPCLTFSSETRTERYWPLGGRLMTLILLSIMSQKPFIISCKNMGIRWTPRIKIPHLTAPLKRSFSLKDLMTDHFSHGLRYQLKLWFFLCQSKIRGRRWRERGSNFSFIPLMLPPVSKRWRAEIPSVWIWRSEDEELVFFCFCRKLLDVWLHYWMLTASV